MRLNFAELALRRVEHGGFDIHRIPSILDQRAFVMAEIAEVEEAAPGGGGLIQEEPGEIADSDMTGEVDDKDWDLEGIMTAEKVESSELQGKMRDLQEKYCSACLENSADMVAVVALAERCLDIECQMMKREQALLKVERKLRAASSAALWTQRSILAKMEEACKCRDDKADAEGRLAVTQVAASKAHNDGKNATGDASKFEAEYVAVVGRRRGEVGGFSKQLRQQAASAAAESKGLAAVHAEL